MARVTLMAVMSVMVMLAVSVRSQAEVLITNLTGGYSYTGTYLNGGVNDNLKAAGFRMGDNSFLLNSVELRLGSLDAPSLVIPGSVPLVRVFDNGVGDEPGNLLVTLNNPAFNYGETDDTYAFTPSNSFELVANTDYWLVVSNEGGDSSSLSSFHWLENDESGPGADDGSLPVGPMATHIDYLYFPSGGPWESSNAYNAYAVNGIIPEPATGILLALGLAALAGANRRSRQDICHH